MTAKHTPTQRESGFYWVKVVAEFGWQPAGWTGWTWWLLGSPGTFTDTDFAQIGERLEPPKGLSDDTDA